jgi:hypothetical protein
MRQQRMYNSSLSVGLSSDRRRQIRQLALLRVALLHAAGVSDICVVRNVSPNGLSARVYRKLCPGDQLEIEFRSGELLAGSVVWEQQFDVGIVFREPIDVAQVLGSRQCTQANKRRALPRIAVPCAGKLSNGLKSTEVMLRDISQGGASLESRVAVSDFGSVHLSLPALPPIAGVIRWISGPNVGVSFNECLSFETLGRWIQARREGLELTAEEISTGPPRIRSVGL